MDRYERQEMIDQLQADNAETLANMAERLTRRECGEEPPQWQAPQREPVVRSVYIPPEPREPADDDRLEKRLFNSAFFRDVMGQVISEERGRAREHVDKALAELRRELQAEQLELSKQLLEARRELADLRDATAKGQAIDLPRSYSPRMTRQ